MGYKEIEYIDPIPEQEQKVIPIGLRLLAVRALIEEAILYPKGTSYIGINVERKKIIVKREIMQSNKEGKANGERNSSS